MNASTTYWAVVHDEVRGPFSIHELLILEGARDIASASIVRANEPSGQWTTWENLTPVANEARRQMPVVRRAGAPPSPPPLPVAKIAEPELSRAIYIFLAFFLGSLGVHNFYAGHAGSGICQAGLSLVAFVLIANALPAGFLLVAIVGVWLLADIISRKRDGVGRYMR